MKILIIEDNVELHDSIKKVLQEEQYTCESAYTVEEALRHIKLYTYDCVLLDLTLPDGSGLDVLEHIKQNGREEGVIIITAKDALEDKIKGLRIGADDYLTKPFHLSELSIRIYSLIRRSKFQGNNDIQYADLRIALDTQTVYYQDTLVENLTKMEYKLLLFFVSNPKRVLSKEAIAENLIGDFADNFVNFDFIYAHIKNVKKKLKKAGCDQYIKSIYGMGYKFDYTNN